MHGANLPLFLVKVFLASALVVLASGCSSPSSRVTQFTFGTADTLGTTGNFRLVTQRGRLQSDGTRWPIICTEPSPDYAIQFGTKIDVSGKTVEPDGSSAEGKGTLETTEQALDLKGRTAGVLALRDGLYAACQAYANGVIGQDAYSLILSQYGTLLIAIVNPPGDGHGAPAPTSPPGTEAMAALIVACLSRNDPSRSPVNANDAGNPLLDLRYCRKVMEGARAYAMRRRG